MQSLPDEKLRELIPAKPPQDGHQAHRRDGLNTPTPSRRAACQAERRGRGAVLLVWAQKAGTSSWAQGTVAARREGGCRGHR